MRKLLFVALSLAALATQAAETIKLTPYLYWSGGSTNLGGSTSYVVVPAHSSQLEGGPAGTIGAQAIVTSLSVTSDLATAVVQGYKVATVAVATFTNSTVSLPVATTNTSPGNIKWDSGTVVIRHMLTDQYEKRTLTTSGGTTNLELTAAPLETVVPGDLIYQVTTVGAPIIAIGGATTLNLSGENLIAGQPGMPILLQANGTSACSIENVSAKYVLGAPITPRLSP